MLSSSAQFANASLPIVLRLSGREISFSFEQPLKAPAPTVTVSCGITIFSSETQSLNAPLPIDERDAGRETYRKPRQPEKACSPIFSMPSGIETPTIPLCPAKAIRSISVTALPSCRAGIAIYSSLQEPIP